MKPSVRNGYLLPDDTWENRIALLRFVEDIPLTPKDRRYSLLSEIQNRLPKLMGPMNREEEIERVERHLKDAVSKGAKIVAGGRRKEGQFFEPTILKDVTGGMLIATEETFGPVMNIMPVDSAEDAVAIANSLEFGLTASVWSKDLEKAERLASEVQAGTISINQPVGSVVQAPWGGVKKSGIGRLLGPEAIREFTNPVNYRIPSR